MYLPTHSRKATIMVGSVPESKSAGAVRGEDRIASLDEIRGYAVLGILTMNISVLVGFPPVLVGH